MMCKQMLKAAPLVVLTLLAGCAGFEANREAIHAQEDVKHNDSAIAQWRLEQQRKEAAVSNLVEEVDTPFTGSHQINAPVATQWPAALQRTAQVEMWFSDNVVDTNGNVIIPISDFAEKIHLVTGVPVRVKPDALLDEAGKVVAVTVPVKFKAGLPVLFDQLAARYRVHAQFTNGELEFFRTTTRRFNIGVAPATAGGAMSIESGGNGSDGGFNSTTSLKSTFAEVDSAKTLIAGVKQWLSKGSPEPVYNPATGTLTITDTPEVLDKVGEYIESESRLMRRGIDFDVDVIRFSSKRNGQSGVNWQLVYQRIAEMNSTATLFSSPGLGLTGAPGSIGTSFMGGTDGQSRFAGSTAMLAALNEEGTATVLRHITLETVNRVGVMHAINKTFDYVNEVSASTSLSGVAVGQKTKTENVGRTLMLVPSINSDSEASVDITIRESIKNPFGKNTSGSGASQTTVQLLDKDTEVARQRVTLKNGESRVLAAIGNTSHEGTDSTMDEHLSALFGGSVTGNRAKDQYYVVVTMRFRK